MRPDASPLRRIAFEESGTDPPYRPALSSRNHKASRASAYRELFDDRQTSGLEAVGADREYDVANDFSDEEVLLSIDAEEAEFENESADELLGPDTESDLDDSEVCAFSFRDDACGLFHMLYCDALACITWPNALILGAAAGGAVAIRDDLDGRVRDHTARHPQTWGEGTQVLRQFGEFSYQVPVIAGIYGIGLWTQDEHTHEFSKTLISAYSITAITTVVIKGIANTHRPTNEFQDGKYGFPSYHAASGFAIAAVADEYYGWPVGIPCYVLAGLVGWTRIDQREHDLSDVFFGSVLGFVIGKSISAAHMDGITGCQVLPCYDPATKSFGAVFHKKF